MIRETDTAIGATDDPAALAARRHVGWRPEDADDEAAADSVALEQPELVGEQLVAFFEGVSR